jgi:hypothetical protein
MIKGLALTPPVLGRISIGKVTEKNGKRLPEKDDEFTLTTQVQSKGQWIKHPLDEHLRQQEPNNKLRTIPIRLLFNDPDLNFRANYAMFDHKSGRPVCVGNGEQCKRLTTQGMQSLACPSPMACEYGQAGYCKPYGRLNVVLGEEDELGTFVFRTTGYNSIRTLLSRLHYFSAVSNEQLATLPLALRIRAKSTTQSFRQAIYYVDITTRPEHSLSQAIAIATETNLQLQQSGFDQQALDQAARLGFANGEFEDSEEEGLEVVEEFYPDTQQTNINDTDHIVSSLSNKLNNTH